MKEDEIIGYIIVGMCAGALGYIVGLLMAIVIVKFKIKDCKKMNQTVKSSSICDEAKKWADEQLNKETEEFEKILKSLTKKCKIIDVSERKNDNDGC